MTSNGDAFKTIAFDDGSYAVVTVDAANPRRIEVVATFFEEERARDYAAKENGQTSTKAPASPKARQETKAAPTVRHEAPAANGTAASELSARQSAVLNALRSRANEKNEVEARAASLAAAAKIPLGSLHSVLQSLEKKHLIQTTRAGSAKAPAIYQVL